MNHRECACRHPALEKVRYRAYLQTGSGGVYSSGQDYDEAVANVKAHARKDGWPKKSWGEVWVVNLDYRCDECGQEHPSCDVTDESKQILCLDCRLSKKEE